jgi:site-specific recombinase XerD
MLDSLFQDAHHVHRLRANPLGALFDPFAGFLIRRGHASSFIHLILRAVEHFGYWLATQYVAITAAHVTKATARRFLDEHLPACPCPLPFPGSRGAAQAGINHLLRMLAQDDPTRLLPLATPHGALLAEYDHFLRQTCGLAERTCVWRLHFVRQFLQRCYGDAPADFSQLRPADFQDYFRRYTGHLKASSIAALASSLRSFLRFLAVAHAVDATLAGAVPMAPCWPRDRLPRTLTEAELQAILASFDKGTATGRRNLAMVRCMSDLGLRIGEVVALTLDDIDWRQGVLRLPAGKGRRERLLPLPGPLGEAITAYLCCGRPTSADRHLFLRHTVPVGVGLNPNAAAAVFRQACARATGRSDAVGPHVLRHTAATRMRAAGHSLKGIADVLGHLSVDSTTIYVRLDVEALRAVAQPWPGVQS